MDSRKLVWVVDDDETLLLMAEEVLKDVGFTARTFTDAQSAWDAATERLPDIILLDVLLPGMGGFEFCSKLRSLPEGGAVPVLMMTSLEDPDSINKAYEAGATDFAIKPINWIIETRRLRYMLRAADVARELKETERETRKIKEDWERTFDSIRDVVTVLDPDLRVMRANSATAELLDKPLDSIIGSHCYELFQGANEPCPGCPLIHAKETGSPESREMEYVLPGGLWEIEGSPTTDQTGRLTHIVHVARNISEQKRLETEYREAQKMEAVGTLAGGIAHEFNNLLQIILGYADHVVSRKDKSTNIGSEMQAIVDAATRGGLLTKQILTFSRRGSGLRNKQLVCFNELIQDLMPMLDRGFPKNVSLKIQLTPELAKTHADRGELQQILMNLAVNAAQAMPNGGTLSIETQNVTLEQDFCRLHPDCRPGEFVLLIVSDTGHGMDGKIQEHIYEPFFTTKNVGEGTGLGLSVVSGIVKDYAGYIACYSEPGLGTTFKVYLPGHGEASWRPVRDALEKEPTTIGAGSKTIMIVDDEHQLRKLISAYLTREGYSVIPASDGETALRICREAEKRPDLVILDLGMPGMSGWDCLQKLRDLDSALRILVATGYAEKDVMERARLEGVCDVTFKPYKLHELSKKVRELIDA